MNGRAMLRNGTFWWALTVFLVVSLALDGIEAAFDGGAGSASSALPPPSGHTVNVDKSSSASTPERAIAPLPLSDPPDGIEFVFSDDLPPAAREEIRGMIGLAARYFSSTGGGVISNVTVVVDDDPERLSETYRKRSHLASGPGDSSFWTNHAGVFTGEAVYVLVDAYEDYQDEYDYSTPRSDLRDAAQATIIHELSHALAARLAGAHATMTGDFEVPRWLVEGAAEVDAYTALDAFGFLSYEDERESRMSSARQLVATIDSTNARESQDPYTLGFLAVDRLTASGDLRPLRQFWLNLHRAESWQAAFEDAFGISPGSFLLSFEEYRVETFPRYRGEIRGTVEGANSSTRIDVWACSRGDGGCYTAATDKGGGFIVAVPDDRYTIRFETRSAPGSRLSYYPGFDDEAAANYFAGSGAIGDFRHAAVVRVYGDVITGVDVPLSAVQPD
jgi:hypothetical protein